MKKIGLLALCYPLIILFLLICDTSVFAEEQNHEKSGYLLIESGLEYLYYSEYVDDFGIKTDSSIYTRVLKLEGSLRLKHIFTEIKCIFPVAPKDQKETWERNGHVYQTNNLEYSWIRTGGNIGYCLFTWMNPYLGLRWTKSTQKRSNFEAFSGSVAEINKAFFMTAGMKGALQTSPLMQFEYSLEYCEPVSAHTENSSFPGWKVSAKNGYTVGARVVARYKCTPTVSLFYDFSGEMVYWNGSGWTDYNGDSVKWPKNKTISVSCLLGIAYTF